MQSLKTSGWLLIGASLALLVPYTILTITFDYPGILREDTATILSRFHAGGEPLIWTWFAFGISGIPLIPAFILIGKELKGGAARIGTTLGLTALILQMIGLLRWTFVVPVLAKTFVNSTDPAIRAATVVVFQSIHQFAGVLMGEHLGQLFTIAWTVLISYSLFKTGILPNWLNKMGYLASAIYLMAQAEMLATVMPSFPVWEMAGFVGSTLWLIWLILVGARLARFNG